MKKDKGLINELVESNLGLVNFTIKKYFGGCVGTQEYEDFYQEGCFALFKAAQSFDSTKGYKFSSYAVTKIYYEILHYKRDTKDNLFAVPREVRVLTWKLIGNVEDVSLLKNKDYVIELAKRLELDLDKVMFAIEVYLNTNISSLDEKFGTDGEKPIDLTEILSAENHQYKNIEFDLDLSKALSKLDPTYLKVFKMRYEGDYTQSQIAEKLGVTQVRVSRILKRTTDKLKPFLLYA